MISLSFLHPSLLWQARASCQSTPSSVFFPTTPATVYLAKSICAVCPVIDACRFTARYNREEFGVWGGETAAERRDYLLYHPEHPRRQVEAPRKNGKWAHKFTGGELPIARVPWPILVKMAGDDETTNKGEGSGV